MKNNHYYLKFFTPLKDDLYKWRKTALILMWFFSLIIIPAPLTFYIYIFLYEIFLNENFWAFLSFSVKILFPILVLFFSWIFFTLLIVKKSKANLQKYRIFYYILLTITFNFVGLYFVLYVNKNQEKMFVENLDFQELHIFSNRQILTVKDKWFYFKLFSAIFAWSAIIFSFIYHLVNKIYIREIESEFSYELYIDQFISFFTHQSNILVATWFTLALLFHNRKKNHWFFQMRVIINVTTYISVTSLTFLLVIYPASFKSLTVIEHLISLSLHLVVPFLMVFYAFNQIGQEYINYKNYWSNSKRGIVIMMIYPTLYCAYIIIRLMVYLMLRYNLNVGFPYLPKHFFPNYIYDNQDYDFLIKVGLIWAFVIIAVFIFVNLFLFINLNIVYIKINNHKYVKKLKLQKNQKIIKDKFY